jgi:uridine kinase
MKPFLIGVAGPSGAGKSELSRLMARRLPGGTALISLDSYYRALSHLPLSEREKCNFDHPDSLDWELIHSHLDAIRQGLPIDEPVYLFHCHSRAAETRRVEPAPFVILEGLFALHDSEVRRRLDARIFVIAPDDVCLSRRLARDTVERGRTQESVLRQYAETVRPMAERFVLPTERYADLVVSGVEPLEHSWEMCRDLVAEGQGTNREAEALSAASHDIWREKSQPSAAAASGASKPFSTNWRG